MKRLWFDRPISAFDSVHDGRTVLQKVFKVSQRGFHWVFVSEEWTNAYKIIWLDLHPLDKSCFAAGDFEKRVGDWNNGRNWEVIHEDIKAGSAATCQNLAAPLPKKEEISLSWLRAGKGVFDLLHTKYPQSCWPGYSPHIVGRNKVPGKENIDAIIENNFRLQTCGCPSWGR